MNEYAQTFASIVEVAADQIAAAAADPKVRRNSLQWKLNAIPAMRAAAFRIDPQGAALDAWALATQMDDFFRSGAGAAVFGELQAIALDAAARALAEIRRINLDVVVVPGKVEKIEADVMQTWAKAHPITDLSFARESCLAQFTDAAHIQGGTLAQVASVEQLVSKLASQARVYAADLPKFVRWQMELGFDETFGSESQMTARLERVAQAAEHAAALADQTPELVRSERGAVLAEVDHQRQLVMGDVAKERETMIKAVDDLFQRTITDIERQRAETLKFVSAERAGIVSAMSDNVTRALDRIGAERTEILNGTDRLVARAVQDVREETRASINRVFMLLGAMLVASVILLPVVAHIYAWVWPQRWRRAT